MSTFKEKRNTIVEQLDNIAKFIKVRCDVCEWKRVESSLTSMGDRT